MKRSYRLLTLLLVLPFLAGTNSFAGNPLIDSVTTSSSIDSPMLTVSSPSGKTVEFYRGDAGWKPVSADQLAGLSEEVEIVPDVILDKINAVAIEGGSAGDPGWSCEVVKHTNGPWTWNCWRDY